MQKITPGMRDRLVDVVVTAERDGVFPHLPVKTPAASREAFLRRGLVCRNHVEGRWELTLEAIGMAEDEIERREHDANEAAARPVLQAAADRALVAQHEGKSAPAFVTVWNAQFGTHYADPVVLRPLCGNRKVFAPVAREVACHRCVKAKQQREEEYAAVLAARERLSGGVTAS